MQMQEALVEYRGKIHAAKIHPRGNIIFLTCNPMQAIKSVDVVKVVNPAFTCNCKTCQKAMPKEATAGKVTAGNGKRGRVSRGDSLNDKIIYGYLVDKLTAKQLAEKFQPSAKYADAFIGKILADVEAVRRLQSYL